MGSAFTEGSCMALRRLHNNYFLVDLKLSYLTGELLSRVDFFLIYPMQIQLLEAHNFLRLSPGRGTVYKAVLSLALGRLCCLLLLQKMRGWLREHPPTHLARTVYT